MIFKLIRTNEIEEKKTTFIHTNQPLMTSFYIKEVPIFFAELAMSQRWSAIFCATDAWGLSQTWAAQTQFDFITHAVGQSRPEYFL